MIGWIDASAGVSGDMLLGALVDLGVSPQLLRDAVDPMGLGVSFEVSQVTRGGLRATKVDVVCPEQHQPHRTLPDVLALLSSVPDAAVRDGAAAVFERIADAEASVHGVARDEVQFHEVGALDAIADIVGVIAGVASLGWSSVHAGPIGLGSGRVGAVHGSLPVPAPAVLALTQGLPVVQGPASFESATPTGVALLAQLVTSWEGMPPMTVEAVGVGGGGRDPETHPNVVRLASGSASAESGPAETHSFQLEANVDDMDPRLWPGAIDAALAAGAVDAWVTPIQMKKGRPAVTFCALVDSAALTAVQRAMFTHTTTIGVRVHEVAKVALDRRQEQVEVDGHLVRVKVAMLDGVEVNRSVEWDDVEAAASALGRPAKDVLAQATAAALGRR